VRRHPMAPAHVVRISVATSGTDFTARDADFAALIRTDDGKSLKSWIVPIPGTTKLHRLGQHRPVAVQRHIWDVLVRRLDVGFAPWTGQRRTPTPCPFGATKGDVGVFRPEDCARSRYSV